MINNQSVVWNGVKGIDFSIFSGMIITIVAGIAKRYVGKGPRKFATFIK